MEAERNSKMYLIFIDYTINNNIILTLLSTFELLPFLYYSFDFKNWYSADNFFTNGIKYIMPGYLMSFGPEFKTDVDFKLYTGTAIILFIMGLFFIINKAKIDLFNTPVITKLGLSIFANMFYLAFRTCNYYFIFLFIYNILFCFNDVSIIAGNSIKAIDVVISFAMLGLYVYSITNYLRYVNNAMYFHNFKHSLFSKSYDLMDVYMKCFIAYYFIFIQVGVLKVFHFTEMVYFFMMLVSLYTFYSSFIPVNSCFLDIYRFTIRFISFQIFCLKYINMICDLYFSISLLILEAVLIFILTLFVILKIVNNSKILSINEDEETIVANIFQIFYINYVEGAKNVLMDICLNHSLECMNEDCILEQDDYKNLEFQDIINKFIDHLIRETEKESIKNLLFYLKILLVYKYEKNSVKISISTFFAPST